MNNFVVVGLIAWILPGLGHILQGRLKRGLVIALAIWGLFAVAYFSGGFYYPGFDYKDGQLLYLLNVFAKLGNGIGSISGYFLSLNPPPNAAASATFEYGGRFLEIAGLLNYLAIIDAIDINLERKR